MNELIPVGKGILATTPAGSGIVTWWNDREAKKEHRDLLEFMKWTVRHVNALHEKAADRLDIHFLESDEFADLFRRLMNGYLKAETSRKRDAYKSVLTNAIRTTRPTDLLRDQYLHVLDQVSDTEMEILSVAYSKQKELAAEARTVLHEKGLPEGSVMTGERVAKQLRISAVETLNIVWSLSSRGLLFPLANDLDTEARITVTPLGANFCRLISDG